MSGEFKTWEDIIEYLRGKGFDDEEIAAEFEMSSVKHPMQMFDRAGHRLAWDSLHDRRRIQGLIYRPSRARAVADPASAFAAALEALRTRDGRLSKTAMATEMGIDRGTLDSYITAGLVPRYPWEKLPRT